ncbi:MAG: XdhC family protein [Candidatus Eisenbacteria bacterium]|nr:XdhC family protein [Candidatus Eisenbacteria bacterium]
MTNEDRIFYRTVAEWIASGRRFVFAIVVAARGSAPRVPGAKMLVSDTGETLGTLGGGVAEREALDAAGALLRANERSRLLTIDLSQETACGGRMEIFLEAHRPEKRLALVGAGHVGRAVARLLPCLGWDLTVYDPREEWIRDPDFHSCRVVPCEFSQAAEKIEFADDLFVLIMTPSHAHDEEVAAGCLRQPWRWMGILGSERKARELKARLLARGLPSERVAKVRVPVGVEIGSDTPDEIAVSIAAELIRETSSKSVRENGPDARPGDAKGERE